MLPESGGHKGRNMWFKILGITIQGVSKRALQL